MKPSEIAAREMRAGLAYLLRRAEEREAAGLPPPPDIHGDGYWEERRMAHKGEAAMTNAPCSIDYNYGIAPISPPDDQGQQLCCVFCTTHRKLEWRSVDAELATRYPRREPPSA
jgi:hypothetical protein